MKHLVLSIMELITTTLLFMSATVAFIITVPFHLLISSLFWVLTGELVWDVSKSNTIKNLYGK